MVPSGLIHGRVLYVAKVSNVESLSGELGNTWKNILQSIPNERRFGTKIEIM